MYDCIIIGAGPAGLMAASQIDKNKKVLLLEKNKTPGKKLLITGGGRCNLTNLKDNNFFLNEVNYNKKYLYSAINKFGPSDIYYFFESRNVPLKIEEDDKVFPKSNKSIDILNTLLKEIDHNIEIKYEEEVIKLKNNNIKEVITTTNNYRCKNIIIATGGSSYPQTGSTGDNLKFAKMIYQPTVPIFPAETSVILSKNTDLAGTSIEDVSVSFDNIIKTGNLMFTHKGLSGTSIMKISEFIYKSNNREITTDLLTSYNEEELERMLNYSNKENEVTTFLNQFFSKKLSTYLINKVDLNKKIKSLTKKDIINLCDVIKKLKLEIKCVNKLENAYVTGGGIDLSYINSMTMESTINKGIYFVGEALDIHGPIGGYNITLALSTGFLAGSNIK